MAVLRMSTEELSRVETLMHVVSGRMTVTQAARLMSVSRRHAHRPNLCRRPTAHHATQPYHAFLRTTASDCNTYPRSSSSHSCLHSCC